MHRHRDYTVDFRRQTSRNHKSAHKPQRLPQNSQFLSILNFVNKLNCALSADTAGTRLRDWTAPGGVPAMANASELSSPVAGGWLQKLGGKLAPAMQALAGAASVL